MTSIVISSGHGKYIRGAAGYLDEVDEARRVVDKVATYLRNAGVTTTVFHDNTSHDQSTNLNTIVNFHNSQPSHDLDVSVHFNAYQTTSKPMGCEVLYVSSAGSEVADEVVDAICAASGLINRGPKKRTDLKFLNACDEVAVLIETCFVDSKADEGIYESKFDKICQAIAESLSGKAVVPVPEPEPPGPPVEPGDHPTIGIGDEGPDVELVQGILGIIPEDGDFGSITEGGVKGFQRATGLGADGIVGPATWEELDNLEARTANGVEPLSPKLVADICDVALDSAIAKYNWGGRGKMPLGYTQGIALCFALAQQRLSSGDPAAVRMARKNTGNADKDVLAWYKQKFDALGMDNSKDGIDTLRHLFALMLGLGPRESAGRYCEGRDMSASNVQSDTAEAGLFQTSWNIRSADSAIAPLLEEFWDNPLGFLLQFQNGVKPDSNDLDNFGTGDGAKYQFLSKFCPAFHAMVTALGLRSLRQHWGPINRNEVELRIDADEMLLEVQALVGAVPEPIPEPEMPTITITIDPPGSARVVIIGGA
jgi:N-acetylmuramoyl-L-alanine amidase/Putative peptidoglycan binding domain